MRELQAGVTSRLVVVLVVLVAVFSPLGGGVANADAHKNGQELVDKAEVTFANFATDGKRGAGIRALTPRAKAVLIFPQVLRAAFLFGAAGGNGVLVVHPEQKQSWIGPAFYTMGEVSFGFQAGGEAAEVALLIMTERGIAALLSTSAKLGVNANVAAGPYGAGGEVATENLSADIISYVRPVGLYGGLSLNGAVIATRDKLNSAYYGKPVKPVDIFIRQTVTNPQADHLLQAVAEVASVKQASAKEASTK